MNNINNDVEKLTEFYQNNVAEVNDILNNFSMGFTTLHECNMQMIECSHSFEKNIKAIAEFDKAQVIIEYLELNR